MRTKPVSVARVSHLEHWASHVLRRGCNLVTKTEVMLRGACDGYAGKRSYGLRTEQREEGEKRAGLMALDCQAISMSG